MFVFFRFKRHLQLSTVLWDHSEEAGGGGSKDLNNIQWYTKISILLDHSIFLTYDP